MGEDLTPESSKSGEPAYDNCICAIDKMTIGDGCVVPYRQLWLPVRLISKGRSLGRERKSCDPIQVPNMSRIANDDFREASDDREVADSTVWTHDQALRHNHRQTDSGFGKEKG